jgi:hypothetical protein
MSMAEIVAWVAIIAAVACFFVYFTEALAARKARANPVVTTPPDQVPGAKTATVADYTKLIEAIAKLSDSLAKSGPALISLIGAVLFLSIAAVASGVLQSPPPETASNAPAKQKPNSAKTNSFATNTTNTSNTTNTTP